jgi:hypothetical protein
MGKMKVMIPALLIAVFSIVSCGGGSSPKPAGDSTAAVASQPTESAPAPAAAKAGFRKIGDVLDAWSDLYKQNEKVLNGYEGMPIMELVTPPLALVTAIQFDLLNPDNKDGRFEGTLALAGFKGSLERSGSKITFGYDRTLEKNGFGPLAKAGDRDMENGSLDLGLKYYQAESSVTRAEKRISRRCVEFKQLADGSMICLIYSGQAFNARGDEEMSDNVIFLSNGKDRYEFVVAKGKIGPDFKNFSFGENGDWTKEKAIEGIKAAGYEIEKSGGIKDGKLVVDK